MKRLNVARNFYKLIYNNYIRDFSITTSRNCHRHIKIEKENKFVTQDLVPNLILQNKIRTADDWDKIRNELLNSSKQITPKTIDSTILSVCISADNYDLGFSYMEYLKQRNFSLGLAAIGKYFKLFYLGNYNKLIIDSESDIYKLYQELRTQYKIFDATTCECIIQALSITSYWAECLTLLNEIKIVGDPNSSSYSVIAAACFKNKENDLGWTLLNECASKSRLPQSVSYMAYIDASELSSNPFYEMEKLFEFFRIHDVKCDKEVANRIVRFYHKWNQDAKFLDFLNSAKCKNCRNFLQKLELTNEEFEELKEAIFKNVIVGGNVFYKSTPQELEEFKTFTTDMKKYDVVIDGLNVAYSVGTRQPPQVLSFFVKSVIKHFVDKNKTVLLLGRKHMKEWPKSNWSYISNNCSYFLAQSLSHDDPYLLYCALHCGLNTIIVSRDLMRSHLFKISDGRLKILFNRWLLQNQYQLLRVNDYGSVYFKYPLPYARTAQKSHGVWHIPYKGSTDRADNKWLCLSNK